MLVSMAAAQTMPTSAGNPTSPIIGPSTFARSSVPPSVSKTLTIMSAGTMSRINTSQDENASWKSRFTEAATTVDRDIQEGGRIRHGKPVAWRPGDDTPEPGDQLEV